MNDEQKAALDLAVLNLKTHGDDQLLRAVQPLIEYYEANATLSAVPDGGKGEAVAHIQYSDELTPRTPSEKAAYLEGIEEGKMRANIDDDNEPISTKCVYDVAADIMANFHAEKDTALTKDEISKLEKECWGTLPTGRPFFDSTKFARAIEQAAKKG